MPSHLASAGLNPATRNWLLGRARAAIQAYFDRQAPTWPQAAPLEADRLRGCFVTIHTLPGDLRGCIGTFEADQPLWRQVDEMAVAAATRDPRFVPLAQGELDSCVLEISALTPRESVLPGDIRVGEHGVWVQKGPHRGVLLPQVATAYDWDSETLLKQTCIKAGLAADAWCDGSVDISVFRAEVFMESERLQ
jgi:AmmeMemoRadiSam system protein A